MGLSDSLLVDYRTVDNPGADGLMVDSQLVNVVNGRPVRFGQCR